MTCSVVKTGDKSTAFICGSVPRIRLCGCDNVSDRVCDWKIGRKRTCDAALCAECTTSPAKNKDLCDWHANMWAKHAANKQQELAL